MQARNHKEMLRLQKLQAATRTAENNAHIENARLFQKYLSREMFPRKTRKIQNIKKSNFSPNGRAILTSYTNFVRNAAKKTELEQAMANLKAAEQIGQKRKRPDNATRRRRNRSRKY
jgi:hypothetical protein